MLALLTKWRACAVTTAMPSLIRVVRAAASATVTIGSAYSAGLSNTKALEYPSFSASTM